MDKTNISESDRCPALSQLSLWSNTMWFYPSYLCEAIQCGFIPIISVKQYHMAGFLWTALNCLSLQKLQLGRWYIGVAAQLKVFVFSNCEIFRRCTSVICWDRNAGKSGNTDVCRVCNEVHDGKIGNINLFSVKLFLWKIMPGITLGVLCGFGFQRTLLTTHCSYTHSRCHPGLGTIPPSKTFVCPM